MQASSTIRLLDSVNSTSTNSTSTTSFFTALARITRLVATSASTTNFTNSGVASTSQLRIDTIADGCLNITGGLVGGTGSACGAGGGGANSKWATSSAVSTSIHTNGANNVGIGTTSPFAALSVVGSSGVVADVFNATNTLATSTFSGSVRIATTSNIASVFHIEAVAGKNPITISDTSGRNLFRIDTTGSTMLKTRTAPVLSGNGLFNLVHGGTDTLVYNPMSGLETGSNWPLVLFNNSAVTSSSTGIGFSVHNAVNSIGGGIVFTRTGAASQGSLGLYTKSSTTTSVPPDLVMILDQFLRVGIGTSSPFAKLSVHNDTNNIYSKTLFAIASSTPTATTTHFKVMADGKVYVGAGQITSYYTMVGGHSTSTWTGTTTINLGPAMENMTVNGARCYATTGTVGVSLYDGTNRADYIPTASSTANFFGYSTNNTFIAGEQILLDMGNPASTPVKVTCRLMYTKD